MRAERLTDPYSRENQPQLVGEFLSHLLPDNKSEFLHYDFLRLRQAILDQVRKIVPGALEIQGSEKATITDYINTAVDNFLHSQEQLEPSRSRRQIVDNLLIKIQFDGHKTLAQDIAQKLIGFSDSRKTPVVSVEELDEENLNK